MFDMSWGEVMVIGAVALIVIGPKDLPKALRTVGQVTGKLRRMASEFQTQFNDAMREAELDEVKKQVEGINQSVSNSLNPGFNPMQTIRDELKGAVEGTPGRATDKSVGETVSDAAAQARGEASSPVPVEPSLALPGVSSPPIVDPARSAELGLEESVASSPLPSRPEEKTGSQTG